MNRIGTKLGKYLLLFCFISSTVFLHAQIQYRVHGVDSSFLEQVPDSIYLRSAPDSLAKMIEETLLLESYLAVSCDSIIVKDSIAHIHMFQGPKITWASPQVDSLTGVLFESFQISPLPVLASTAELLAWRAEIIEVYANKGYPFASIQFDDLWIRGDTLYSKVGFEKGALVLIGRVENEFDIGVSPAVLASLIGISEGSIFKMSAIQELNRTLKNFNYLEQTRDPRLSFEDGAAVITLFLKQKKGSSLNLLLGLIPAGGVPGARLTLTGLADVKTQNLLGRGERLAFKFERLLAQTQTIDLSLSFPYIFNLPFGFESEMYQNRRDSSFNIVKGEVGIASYFKGTNRISLFYGWEQSNLLSFDELSLIAQRQLPNTLDTRARNYGLNIDYSKLDYILNPTKGVELRSKTTLSQKRILPNPVISDLLDPVDPDFDFESLYDEALLTANLLFMQELYIGTYLPLLKRVVFKNGIRAAYQYAGRKILRNEQWILGGNSNLRGFNEGLLFADAYVVDAVELRYLLDQNAYLFAFSDIARLWTDQTFTDYVGVGLGLSFEVQTGIFGISLAVGKLGESPFDFSSPKVHFGFINQF